MRWTWWRVALGVVAALALGVAVLVRPLGWGAEDGVESAPAATESGPRVEASTWAPRFPPAVRREIDRVVDEIRRRARQPVAEASLEDQVAALCQCAELRVGERYCLVAGWTRSSQEAVQRGLVASVRALRRSGVEDQIETGDLSFEEMVRIAASMTPDERATLVREELEAVAVGSPGPAESE